MVKDNAPRQPLCKAAPTQKNFKKFLWKADSKDKFLSASSNPNVQRLFDSFNSEHHASVDDEISQFNQIINSVAKSCLATSRKTSKTTKEKKPWYDHNCRQLKKQLHQLVKKINPSSHQSLRQDYFVLKNKYKKHVKMMHIRYKNQIVNEINALHPEHSQDFWRYINQLRKSDAVEEGTSVSSEDWICHYRKLLHDSQEPHTTLDFSNEDMDWENENSPNNDILGQPITTNEIHEQTSKLKLKKALGMDCILNEMIKHGCYYLMPSLEKLFN